MFLLLLLLLLCYLSQVVVFRWLADEQQALIKELQKQNEKQHSIINKLLLLDFYMLFVEKFCHLFVCSLFFFSSSWLFFEVFVQPFVDRFQFIVDDLWFETAVIWFFCVARLL